MQVDVSGRFGALYGSPAGGGLAWGAWSRPRRGWPLCPLAGLVVTGGLPDDDVHAVVGVDEGDKGYQRGKLVIVVVLGGVRPGLIGDAGGGIGDAGALLGELQGGPFGLSEDRCLPPCRDQVEPQLAFPGVCGVLGVHVGAVGAAVDLTGPDLHQLLRRGRQGRTRHDRTRGVDVLRELGRNAVAVVVEPGIHDGLLAVGAGLRPIDRTARKYVTPAECDARLSPRPSGLAASPRKRFACFSECDTLPQRSVRVSHPDGTFHDGLLMDMLREELTQD